LPSSRDPRQSTFLLVFFPLEFRWGIDIAIDVVCTEVGKLLPESMAEDDSLVMKSWVDDDLEHVRRKACAPEVLQ
jgi:hypothetical protein